MSSGPTWGCYLIFIGCSTDTGTSCVYLACKTANPVGSKSVTIQLLATLGSFIQMTWASTQPVFYYQTALDTTSNTDAYVVRWLPWM
ncbi:uncharacterized protein BJ171DRAFT_39028 [Polychytrium aggregatum]|uniref:uncharacterized protein n=1 Tax=Polychytrium aggregatum TaxID=110093 RepID=UPI0022FE694A|nr:uncharacterized protein BJ171DRAFT_39028 [Polychytrium aggregatum]KAI9205985.1 hypothetical protein BJ171DRAFT_39028 [Polychytrium aggregatum]